MISVIATLLMTRANLGPKVAKLASWGIVIALIGIAAWFAIGAIRSDARNDLLADQAEQQRIANDKQRGREAKAQVAREAALVAGAATDAVQQKEITDATKGLPDTRPDPRQRARVCVELQQQDKAAGRAARSC